MRTPRVPGPWAPGPLVRLQNSSESGPHPRAPAILCTSNKPNPRDPQGRKVSPSLFFRPGSRFQSGRGPLPHQTATLFRSIVPDSLLRGLRCHCAVCRIERFPVESSSASTRASIAPSQRASGALWSPLSVGTTGPPRKIERIRLPATRPSAFFRRPPRFSPPASSIPTPKTHTKRSIVPHHQTPPPSCLDKERERRASRGSKPLIRCLPPPWRAPHRLPPCPRGP